MHKNETFALDLGPVAYYWAHDAQYVEQFLATSPTPAGRSVARLP